MSLKLTDGGGLYKLEWDNGLTMRFERIHEDSKGVVTGEVTIRYEVVANPHIHQARLNLTSTRSRQEVAKQCESRIAEMDWSALIEAACVNVLARYRVGEPVVDLATLKPSDKLQYRAEPFIFESQPTVCYGPGGIGKSLFATYLGVLIADGTPTYEIAVEPGKVLYLDYETSPEELYNRVRLISAGLEMDAMPSLYYRFCSAPLYHDIERIQREVIDKDIQFIVVDSAAPACGGAPESAENTLQFFTALRMLRISSLVVAHVSKNGGDKSGPFGSVFWTNMARSVWELKKSQETDSSRIEIGLWHRKVNSGRLLSEMGYTINFGDTITFRKSEIADVPDLAEHLTLTQQITHALERGGMNVEQIAREINAKPDSVATTLTRKKTLFQNLGSGLWGLKSHR